VLDAATELFLRDGYGATSLEAVAAAAGVSKRTLYARFSGKAALLQVVVARLVTTWLPAFDAEIGQGGGLRDTLVGAARVMLATALTPQALGLYRLIIAEIGRFPELALVMREAGAGAGTDRLAGVMAAAGITDPIWAAEQFMALVLSVPQRRGLGLGSPLDAAAQAAWSERAVELFLNGLSVIEARSEPAIPVQSQSSTSST
jgi:TetR/AcrR family transcriptional regulator, mexJK operon transcriptional repressor